jgi:hypothetical protein
MAPLPASFDIDLTGSSSFGWPVLPHGAGSYFNMTGRYIGIPPLPTSTRGYTYGEFIPGTAAGVTGELLAGAVNYQNNSGARQRVYMANYGGVSPFVTQLIGSALAGFGSLQFSFPSGSGITLRPTDYIGIYVEDATGGGGVAPRLLIEGTLYFSLK